MSSVVTLPNSYSHLLLISGPGKAEMSEVFGFNPVLLSADTLKETVLYNENAVLCWLYAEHVVVAGIISERCIALNWMVLYFLSPAFSFTNRRARGHGKACPNASVTRRDSDGKILNNSMCAVLYCAYTYTQLCYIHKLRSAKDVNVPVSYGALWTERSGNDTDGPENIRKATDTAVQGGTC